LQQLCLVRSDNYNFYISYKSNFSAYRINKTKTKKMYDGCQYLFKIIFVKFTVYDTILAKYALGD